MLAQLKYRTVKKIKSIIKQILPREMWLVLKKRSRVRLPVVRGYEAMLLEDWAVTRRRGEKVINQDLLEGVTLVGFLTAATGLGEAARSSLRALQEARIPYSLVDLDFDVPARQQITHPDPTAPKGFLNRVNLLHVNPNHLPLVWERFGQRALLGRRTIGVWYWELPEIPDEWVPAFQVVDEIWAPSRFIQRAVEARSPVPVHYVPPCIQVEFDPALARADFGLPEDTFLFLCAYDVNSVQARKNPKGAIEAFRRAFNPEDQSVGLVVKINNAEESPDEIARLEESLRGYGNIHFIKRVLPREHFNALIHLTDAYISLHRSEGFGLVAAEAMALGKPVIATNWSGNTDFMTEANSCGVDYKLVPVGEGMEPYLPDQVWAEPDLAMAAESLRKLKCDKQFYVRIGQNSKTTILDFFNTQKITAIIADRLFESNGMAQ